MIEGIEMAEERYAFDVNESVKKREQKLKEAKKNRILYIILFIIFVITNILTGRG